MIVCSGMGTTLCQWFRSGRTVTEQKLCCKSVSEQIRGWSTVHNWDLVKGISRRSLNLHFEVNKRVMTSPWYLLDVLHHSHYLNHLPIEIILVITLIIQYLYLTYKPFCKKCEDEKVAPNKVLQAATNIKWYQDMLKMHSSNVLKVNEWKCDKHREHHGWQGHDYMHAPNSHVRIFDYFLLRSNELNIEKEEIDYALSSAVYFSARAESHKGLCHGGTMCAVMDDAVGWMGFCESGQCLPWSGYTVQVDTSLRKAITIGSTLRLDVWIEKREGSRKFFISARLYNPMTGEDHATCKGLFLKIINKKESKKDK